MKTLLIIGTMATVWALAACQQHSTPADVTKAQADASKEVAEARTDAGVKIAEATREETASQASLEHATAQADETVALTAAKGSYQVAVEKCEAQSGDAQAVCKRQADADLEAARARAHQNRAGADPKL